MSRSIDTETPIEPWERLEIAFEASLGTRGLDDETVRQFRKMVLGYFQLHGRDLPWRKTDNPYHIFVSEVMLQQTQVTRVVGKYADFVRVFPDFRALCQAPLRKVLQSWQGLGYNRRAYWLVCAAQHVIEEFDGALPREVDILQGLPGIGHATACAIAAYAFNAPVVFIETNIRTVFLHFFFPDKDVVHDREILPFVERTLDYANPRRWYYSIMDFGVMLKKRYGNPGRKSIHYRAQGQFEGSNRQLRGLVMRALTQHRQLSEPQLVRYTRGKRKAIRQVLAQFIKEDMVREACGKYSIGQV